MREAAPNHEGSITGVDGAPLLGHTVVMRPREYLSAIGETVDQFAKRAGIPSGTAHHIFNDGSRPRADICERVIKASQDRPAPCGGTIELSDLAANSEAA